MSPRYAELQCTSHFSFLRGASSAQELFATAALLGIEALAVVDRNSVAGIVRAYETSKVTGVRLIVGCRLDLKAARTSQRSAVRRALTTVRDGGNHAADDRRTTLFSISKFCCTRDGFETYY